MSDLDKDDLNGAILMGVFILMVVIIGAVFLFVPLVTQPKYSVEECKIICNNPPGGYRKQAAYDCNCFQSAGQR